MYNLLIPLIMKYEIDNNGFVTATKDTPKEVVEALIDFGVVEDDGIDNDNAEWVIGLMKPGDKKRFYWCYVTCIE